MSAALILENNEVLCSGLLLEPAPLTGQVIFLAEIRRVRHSCAASVIVKSTSEGCDLAGAAIVPLLVNTVFAMTARCVRVVQNQRFFPTSTILAREIAVALPLHPS
mgnify:CR=1 FL=1